MLAARGRRRIGAVGRFAGQQFDRSVVMGRHVMMQRTDQRNARAEAGLAREQFAEVEPRHVGRDRPEGAAIFAGSLRLEVVGFEMTGTAPHPEQDDGRVLRRRLPRASRRTPELARDRCLPCQGRRRTKNSRRRSGPGQNGFIAPDPWGACGAGGWWQAISAGRSVLGPSRRVAQRPAIAAAALWWIGGRRSNSRPSDEALHGYFPAWAQTKKPPGRRLGRLVS